MAETPISPKVTAATTVGAMTTIIVWLADVTGGIEVPAEVGMALTVVIMAGAAYLKRDPLRPPSRPLPTKRT